MRSVTFPSPVNFTPGDGTLPRGPWVAVWAFGEWHEGMVRWQGWMPPLGEEGDELAEDWWCQLRVRGRSVWAPANDLDWGPVDPAVGWLAGVCGVSVDEVKEPVTW